MKQDIHPTYHTKAKVKCACGATFTVGSTLPEIEIEACSECHPFYTGKGNLIDTMGRVDRFKERVKASEKTERGGKKQRKKKNKERRQERAKRIEE